MRSTLNLPQTEAEWQRTVTDYAESLGWDWLHIGRVGKYQANGAKGTLGKGFPDLLLVRHGIVRFVELKQQGEKLKPDQDRVMRKLWQCNYHIWRPSDFALMADTLR